MSGEIVWPRDQWVAIVANGVSNEASRVHSGVLAHEPAFGEVVGSWLREWREFWAIRCGRVEVHVDRLRVRYLVEEDHGLVWQYMMYHPAGCLVAISDEDEHDHNAFARRMRARRAGGDA